MSMQIFLFLCCVALGLVILYQKRVIATERSAHLVTLNERKRLRAVIEQLDNFWHRVDSHEALNFTELERNIIHIFGMKFEEGYTDWFENSIGEYKITKAEMDRLMDQSEDEYIVKLWKDEGFCAANQILLYLLDKGIRRTLVGHDGADISEYYAQVRALKVSP